MATQPLEAADLIREAETIPGFAFEEGDVPVLVTTGAGTYQKVPRRLLGGATGQGYIPVEGERLESAVKARRIVEEQAGVVPAIVAGTEQALSTATFGLTDAAMMGLAFAAGKTKDEYLRARAERQEGSPLASGIGTAVGLVAPALLAGPETLAGAAVAEGAEAASLAARAASAAQTAAGTVGVGGVMRAGRAATELAERGLSAAFPSVLSAEQVAEAYRAARVAGAAAAPPSLRAVAATALKTGAERAIGGAVEGALWGAGEGVRESILGQSDDVAESVMAHAGTDALLFSVLGGGLGVMDAALPTVLSGARKIADRVYDKIPAFGRDTLRARWAAEPGKTGVMAETADELFAQRERLVALDERFGTVLDSLAATSPDAVRAAASHVDAIEAFAAGRKGALDTVLGAPAEVRDAILENASAALSFEARAKGSLDQLVNATPDRLQAAFANGAALDALMAGDKRVLGRVLELKSDVLTSALENVEGIAALEDVTAGKAILAMSRMRPEVGKWYAQNAGRIAEMEAGLPGYWQIFRAMTKGSESEFSVTQAEDILSNWQRVLLNPRERASVAADAIEQKAAEIEAGEKLAMQLYQVSQAVEGEAFLKVGEIGGPPSLEGVQKAIQGLAEDAQSIANRVSDVVSYDPKLAKEIADIATLMRRDFVGLTEGEIKAGIESKAETFLGDPEAAFERIKEYRRNLGARIRKLEGKRLQLTPATEDTLDAMIDLRDAMTTRYHDPAIFGDAAVSRARADDAFRRWRQANDKGGLFDKSFRETVLDKGVQKRVIARKKVNTWLNQMGDARDDATVLAELGNNSSAWAEVSDAFINLIRTTEELLPKVGKATVEINPEELQALAQRTINATKELEERGFYTREMFQLKAHAAGGELNLIGLPPGLTTMGGFPHGVPTAISSGPESLFGLRGGMPPEVAAVADAATTVASAVPGGGLAAKGLTSLLSIPTQQRQVAARVRGMVAIEKMGRRLADGIEDGARWLVGQATGKKIAVGEAFRSLTSSEADPVRISRAREAARAEEARRPVARAAPAAAAREEQATIGGRDPAELDRMIREANRLAADPSALAELIEQQSRGIGRELPETTAAVGRLMARAAKTIAKAAPVPDGQPLDVWQPSASDRAAMARVLNAASSPLDLYSRALDGTLTKAEVDTVAEIAPGTLAKMRAAAQAHVEAARVEGRVLPAQYRRGVETLLGYPLTTGSAQTSIQRNQGVFGAARSGQSERPSDGLARPLPGAARVTLGDRYMTPQQSAAAR